MRQLTLFLFAALMTISIINVGAKPAKSWKLMDANCPWQPVGAYPKGQPPCNSRAIRQALEPIKEDIQFSDIFSKILIGLKERKYEVMDAINFSTRLHGLFGKSDPFWPYVLMFEVVVLVYRDLHKLSPDKITFIKVWDTFGRYEAYYDDKTRHRFSDKAHNLLMDFLLNKGDMAEQAKEIFKILLTDKEVISNIDETFKGADPKCDVAFKRLKEAIPPEDWE